MLRVSTILPGLRRGKLQDLGVCQNYGYPFGGPYNKDYSRLGSILALVVEGFRLQRSDGDVALRSGLSWLLDILMPNLPFVRRSMQPQFP